MTASICDRRSVETETASGFVTGSWANTICATSATTTTTPRIRDAIFKGPRITRIRSGLNLCNLWFIFLSESRFHADTTLGAISEVYQPHQPPPATRERLPAASSAYHH